MVLDEKPWIYAWAPLYRNVVSPTKRRIWNARVSLDEVRALNERQMQMLEELRALRAENARQWAAIERLLLSVFAEGHSRDKR
jgi:type II secretory pathway component PulM